MRSWVQCGSREPLGDGRWLVEVHGEPVGEMPLPPYIHEPLADPERYQTVYGTVEGSAAAPTAGLHLTPELVAALDPVRVTLHVGLDTFRPVIEASLEEHELHGERYDVDAAAWERIARAERVLAVGTTTVRVLETVARSGELVGRTTLFITPGFAFRRVDALLTNFHLPRSTLLALVMAFAGVDAVRAIYREPRSPSGTASTRSAMRWSCSDVGCADFDHVPARRSPAARDMSFALEATDGAARAGVLTTGRGDIRTPAFMPVGTKGTVKGLHPDEVRALGADVILGNTYHLHFRPGERSHRSSSAGSTHSPAGAGRS